MALDRVYIISDALRVKIMNSHIQMVKDKPFYMAPGTSYDGVCEILDFWKLQAVAYRMIDPQ
jgi:transposase-like protein